MNDHDTQALAGIAQRLDDLRHNHNPEWTVVQSPSIVPCYAFYERKFHFVTVAILHVDEAVAYMSARENELERALAPTNMIKLVHSDAVTCLKAAMGYVMFRRRMNMTADVFHRERAAAVAHFVADVVTRTATP